MIKVLTKHFNKYFERVYKRLTIKIYRKDIICIILLIYMYTLFLMKNIREITLFTGYMNRGAIEKSALTFASSEKLLQNWIIYYSYFCYFINKQRNRDACVW